MFLFANDAIVKVDVELKEVTKNGKTELYASRVKSKIDITKYGFEFNNNAEGSQQLHEVLSQTINENSKEIIKICSFQAKTRRMSLILPKSEVMGVFYIITKTLFENVTINTYNNTIENTPKTISTISLPKCSYIKSKQQCEGSLTQTSQSQMNKRATFSSNYEKTLDSTPKRINDLNEKQHKSKKLSGISSANFGKTKPAMMERHQEWHDECYLSDIQGECRDYVQKEFKKLSRQLYKIEALLKEPNAGRGCRTRIITVVPVNNASAILRMRQSIESGCEHEKTIHSVMKWSPASPVQN
ncbi:uncharacterized protein LOC113004867 [Solenopsis invicta]|uniref:uncharacterized protein LOC113004867 n=1 Tax=Solenopsis invicta TaxID=13686 RepID=UPI00193E863D|nr:uncharacterized protein LOC113004867 [Solenopsis invicta]